jgi:hypothetical protein
MFVNDGSFMPQGLGQGGVRSERRGMAGMLRAPLIFGNEKLAWKLVWVAAGLSPEAPQSPQRAAVKAAQPIAGLLLDRGQQRTILKPILALSPAPASGLAKPDGVNGPHVLRRRRRARPAGVRRLVRRSPLRNLFFYLSVPRPISWETRENDQCVSPTPTRTPAAYAAFRARRRK